MNQLLVFIMTEDVLCFSVDLYEAAEIMKKYGVINAINLDGGGSSTMVINDTLVNYPSDKWSVVSLKSLIR